MIPAAFEYHRPASLAEAVTLLAGLGEEARVLAGGHSLIPMMKLRMALPEHLVDLQGLDELKGVREEGDDFVIGAMTTQREIVESTLLARHCPILRETAEMIADPQVRYCGTIGGNLANGDPGNDMPAVMQALGARFLLEGPAGSREVAARDFYEAAFFTQRAEDEILTAVAFPRPAPAHGWAYVKQKRKVGDYATAAAAVILSLQGGRCSAASIALTNLGDTPLLVEEGAAALVGGTLEAAAVDAAVEAAKALVQPASDGRGPPEFRRHVAGIMVRRAIETARSRAA